jgi:hypothetical protein
MATRKTKLSISIKEFHMEFEGRQELGQQRQVATPAVGAQ